MRTFVWGLIAGVLLVPALALVAALAGLLPAAATAEPPDWEVALAQRALARSVARQAPAQANPVTPSSENLRAGMRLYRDNCAGVCRSSRPSLPPEVQADWQAPRP